MTYSIGKKIEVARHQLISVKCGFLGSDGRSREGKRDDVCKEEISMRSL